MTETTVGPDVPLVVEHLGRRAPAALTGFEFTVSIWRRLSGDLIPTSAVGGDSGGGGGDDDDDDGDDDDGDPDEIEGVDEEVVEVAGLDGRWVLADASFSVKAGEAVALVGSADSGAETLLHVLDRRLAPDRGRALIAGRASRTPFFNSIMAPNDIAVGKQVAALARAARVPRRSRRRWIADVLDFALHDIDRRNPGVDSQFIRRRIGIAASLDATADVVLVDQMPWREAPAFRDASLERLRAAVRGGSAAVLGGNEPLPFIELCTRAIRFENGVIVEEGDPGALLDAEQRRLAGRRRAAARRATGVVPFNAHAAILGGVVRENPDGGVEIALDVETTVERATLEPRLVLRPAESGRAIALTPGEPFDVSGPGRYRIVAAVGIPDDMPAFAVDVTVDVRIGSAGSVIGRTNIGTIGATPELPLQDGADVDLPGESDESDAIAEWRCEAVNR